MHKTLVLTCRIDNCGVPFATRWDMTRPWSFAQATVDLLDTVWIMPHLIGVVERSRCGLVLISVAVEERVLCCIRMCGYLTPTIDAHHCVMMTETTSTMTTTRPRRWPCQPQDATMTMRCCVRLVYQLFIKTSIMLAAGQMDGWIWSASYTDDFPKAPPPVNVYVNINYTNNTNMHASAQRRVHGIQSTHASILYDVIQMERYTNTSNRKSCSLWAICK